VVDFPRPADIVQMEVCVDSGAQPSEDCPADRRKMELFAGDQPPLSADHDLYRRISTDLWTGLEANEYCQEATEDNLYVVIDDPDGLKWVEETAAGRQWAADRGIVLEAVAGDPSPRLKQPPAEACNADTPRPTIVLSTPAEDQTVTGELVIYGQAVGPNMRGYQVEYGVGNDPQGWGLVQELVPHPVEAGELARWDTKKVSDGDFTLRVILYGPDDQDGNPVQIEQRVHFHVLNPTSTPTITPSPTATYTPSATPTSTATPSPTPTATSTSTPEPSMTPTPTATQVEATQTATATPTSEQTPTTEATATATSTPEPTATSTPTPSP
jgi:hypothetical protein